MEGLLSTGPTPSSFFTEWVDNQIIFKKHLNLPIYNEEEENIILSFYILNMTRIFPTSILHEPWNSLFIVGCVMFYCSEITNCSESILPNMLFRQASWMKMSPTGRRSITTGRERGAIRKGDMPEKTTSRYKHCKEHIWTVVLRNSSQEPLPTMMV